MRKNLLIAVNSSADCVGLMNAFSQLEDVRLLPAVSTGQDAIETILSKDVHVLIMDMLLPQKDGLDVLDYIDRISGTRRPLTFLMSAFTDDRLLSMVQNRVLYCFTKPLDYELVLLRVLQLIHSDDKILRRDADRRSLLTAQISSGIRAIGVPAHLKGYYYLREAILIYAEMERPYMLNITTDIYPRVAESFHTKPSLVEHAIRNAIEIGWTRGNIETLHEYFGYTVNDYRGKPSNYEFIAMMAERALSYVNRS